MTMKIAAVLILSNLFALSASAQAVFTTYNVIPSYAESTASGIQFNQVGGSFIMINVVMKGPIYITYDPPSTNKNSAVTPLYLSFAVANGVPDKSGVIQYQPDSAQLLLFIADANRKVYFQGQFIPSRPPTIQRIAGTTTGWRFSALVNNGPLYQISSPSSAAQLTVNFDTSLLLGKQITGGTFYYLPFN